MKHTKSYIKGHPRNQFTRTSFWNLNGTWEFAFDDENKGYQEGWHNGFHKQYDILVPYVYQTPKSGVEITKQHKHLWYQRKMECNLQKGKRYILHFEGVDYLTKVFMNGLYVGKHEGAYERFSFDVTKQLKQGENLITVYVYDDYSCLQPRGKQRWLDHSYECFYTETSGIWKTVWLEEVSEVYLKQVRMTPNMDNYSVEIEYEVNNTKDLEVEIETIISFQDYELLKNKTTTNQTSLRLSLDMKTMSHHWHIHAWTPHCPNLYDVMFNIYIQGKKVDTVLSYLGMRKLESKGNTIFLNYSPLYVKMVLDQGYFVDGGLTPTEEELMKDIQLMKQMGFNGVRKHEKIEDENFLYYADVLGLLVWLECPSTYEFSHQSVTNLSKEWIDIVNQNYNHPSIMTYVIYNESWGVTQISGNQSQQNATLGLYYLTKSLDNTRFVISNDGWEHTKSDIVTLHNYAETQEVLAAPYRDMYKNSQNQKALYPLPRRSFVGDFQYSDNQPLILSEFAGIAFKKDAENGWGYGNSVQNEEEFIQKLKGQMLALKELKDFSGYCITQLTDVYQEVNGLLDMKRNPKCKIERIKELNDLF